MQKSDMRGRCLAFSLIALLLGCTARIVNPPAVSTLPIVIEVPGSTEKLHQLNLIPLLETEVGSTSVAEPLSPPSPEKIARLKKRVSQQDRLDRVAAPLLISNADLCQRHARYVSGLNFKTKYSFTDDFVDEAGTALELDQLLRVTSIMPGSAAALSGLLVGDVLYASANRVFSKGRHAERAGQALIEKEIRRHAVMMLTVKRGTTSIALRVPPTFACDMPVLFGDNDIVSSFADGRRLLVTSGMLNFVQSDQELAYVLAKEMAHNILYRAIQPDMRLVIDGMSAINGRLAANAVQKLHPYKPVVDGTADKIALYLLVRAGYDIAAVPDFWQRLEKADPAGGSESYIALHPSTKYRLSIIKQIIKTIVLKQKNQLALIP